MFMVYIRSIFLAFYCQHTGSLYVPHPLLKAVWKDLGFCSGLNVYAVFISNIKTGRAMYLPLVNSKEKFKRSTFSPHGWQGAQS